jgi:ATP/ADP translocase
MTKTRQAFMNIRREELPLALLMFSYFFLVITCFWILKPIKKGLFIEFYDEAGFDLLGVTYLAPQAELLAKVLNMVVAFGAVVVFTRLSRQLRRQQLTFVFAGFFIACYLLFGQWLHTPDDVSVGRHFALVFSITNWVSLLVQLFLTSFIMTRFGMVTALLVLPFTIALGSSAFLLFPALWVGSMLSTADNGFSYSINQSAKEALYVPTSEAEKYRAKAFIDMFVQRFAKAIAVLISLGITFMFKDIASLRYLGLLTLGLIVVWVVAARYAGRQFNELESQ